MLIIIWYQTLIFILKFYISKYREEMDSRKIIFTLDLRFATY